MLGSRQRLPLPIRPRALGSVMRNCPHAVTPNVQGDGDRENIDIAKTPNPESKGKDLALPLATMLNEPLRRAQSSYIGHAGAVDVRGANKG